MSEAGYTIANNTRRAGLKAIILNNKQHTDGVLEAMLPLMKAGQINFLFSTNMMDFLSRPTLYHLNSIRFIYYCISDRLVPRDRDHDILFVSSILARLQYIHKGTLSSFTLASSPEMMPLSLGSRRLPAMKKAAMSSLVYDNDIDTRGEMIRGEIVTGGIHNPTIRVDLDAPDIPTPPLHSSPGITRAEIYALFREVLNKEKVSGRYKIETLAEMYKVVERSGAVIHRGEEQFSIVPHLHRIRSIL
jgi:hypothetical protein